MFCAVAERPQHMLMRVAVGIHKEDIDAAIETYNLLSEKWFTHASPTLFNAGTNKPQMSRWEQQTHCCRTWVDQSWPNVLCSCWNSVVWSALLWIFAVVSCWPWRMTASKAFTTHSSSVLSSPNQPEVLDWQSAVSEQQAAILLGWA